MKKEILIVEDEINIAKYLETSLTFLGYSVIGTVETGTNAINKALDHHPDLILMDVRLKGHMDGIQAAEKILKQYQVPIIYLTAYSDIQTIQRAKITEPYGYLVKPFEEKDLHRTIEIALYKHKSEREKEVLKEQVVKLTKKISLTEKEKTVLYGLITSPQLNDIELSNKLNIKRSTVTSIKNKLKRENYYKTIKIPNLAAIGYELFTIIEGNIDGAISDLELQKIIQRCKNSHQIVFATISSNYMIVLCITKNLTEFKKYFAELSDEFQDINFSKKMKTTYFPYEISEGKHFFNYQKYVKNALNQEKMVLENPQKKVINSSSTTTVSKLTKKEKEIMCGIITYPELNDSELEKKLKIPRPSISQTKRKLIRKEFLEILHIPNSEKLKHELVVIKKIMPIKGTIKNTPTLIKEYREQFNSCILILTSKEDLISIHIYDSYSELEEEKEKETLFFEKEHLRLELKEILLLQQIKYEKINFAQLINTALEK